MIDQLNDIFHDFLAYSRSVCWLTVNGKMKITGHNSYFAELLGGEAILTGRSVFDCIAKHNFQSFEAAASCADKTQVKVVFNRVDNQSFALFCTFYKRPAELLILAERPVLTSDEVMQKMTRLNNELVNITREMGRKNRQLEYANSTIKTLRGIVPICSFCKGIRNDEGYWRKLEVVMSEQTEAKLSHSICPDCMQKHYPDCQAPEGY